MDKLQSNVDELWFLWIKQEKKKVFLGLEEHRAIYFPSLCIVSLHNSLSYILMSSTNY